MCADGNWEKKKQSLIKCHEAIFMGYGVYKHEENIGGLVMFRSAVLDFHRSTFVRNCAEEILRKDTDCNIFQIKHDLLTEGGGNVSKTFYHLFP